MKQMRSAIIGFALLAAVILCAGNARAEYRRTDTIHDSLPRIEICVTDTGECDEAYERQNLLRVEIVSEDQSIMQEISYRSSETADHEGAASLARLQDVNFDGYQDLMLLTAQGARNVFYAVSVFNPEERCFEPVLRTHAWNTENKAFDRTETTQLELCNEVLYPEQKLIASAVADGYRYLNEIIYQWEGRYSLVPVSVVSVYDAGDGKIGELLEMHATGIRRCWDVQYPENWYYGEQNVIDERRQSYRLLTIGDGQTDPVFMKVANVDWVNLRRQDSKSSPSLAKLTKGTEVQVLMEDCGTDGGWTRVYVWPQKDETGLTGYIWHSYLEDVSNSQKNFFKKRENEEGEFPDTENIYEVTTRARDSLTK